MSFRVKRLAAGLAITAFVVVGVTVVTITLSQQSTPAATPFGTTVPNGSIPNPILPGATSRAREASQPKGTRSYSVVVNKRRPLIPRDYVPADLVPVRVPYIGARPLLRREAAIEVESLFAAFTKETGLKMQSNSAYRSYSAQQAEYRTFSRKLGTAAAEETTALPGYSEHQTGLAIDIGARGSSCSARDCFAATPQGQWLAHNAWRFGFIIRYPEGQQAVTGYSYEPWHIRFVGTTLAGKIHGHFGSLEAYFHLPAAPSYVN
jgi:D-alanyl-D-alanine carboxypeptidase